MDSSDDKNVFAKLWDALKAFQNRIAIALTVVILFVLYFTVFAVIAIVTRLMGKDLLHPEKPEAGSYWIARPPVENVIEQFSRQF